MPKSTSALAGLLSVLALASPLTSACQASAPPVRAASAAPVASRLEGCPGPEWRERPHIVWYEDQAGRRGGVEVLGVSDGVLHYRNPLLAPREGELRVYGGLFTLSTHGTAGVTFTYDHLPEIPPLTEGTTISAEATVRGPGRRDRRDRVALRVLGPAQMTVGPCTVDVIRIQATMSRDGGPETILERWFHPATLLTLRTIEHGRTKPDGSPDPRWTIATGFEEMR